ncbi:hypothetical protein SCOCK_10397 [Actinacidiphila cocklensis]|uniref:Uncharacterized protein n=1 Tax=Actinacidiphila cocklensis TaxID=887465 RepID=A0A9W4DGI8_9ACTN|nr:hypothetical protein SCOCK_10397 [Actinacidiphila cocklensis]
MRLGGNAVTVPSSDVSAQQGYSMSLADGSYSWYSRAAIKARRYFRRHSAVSSSCSGGVRGGVPVPAQRAAGRPAAAPGVSAPRPVDPGGARRCQQ